MKPLSLAPWLALFLLSSACGEKENPTPNQPNTAAAVENKTPEPAADAFTPEILPIPEAPDVFGEVTSPDDNPVTEEKVALGRQLWFDKRLSADESVSCYSCHLCENGLTDGRPTAIGANGKKLTRSSPTLWNIGYHSEFYWDGRSPSLEKQAMAAWKGGNMGADPEKVVKTLNGIAGYNQQFQKVFSSEATPENVVQAITAFERTSLFCADTPFDKWQGGDQSAVSDEVKEGWEVFRGKANCGTCHAGGLFTDMQYHNIGIGMKKSKAADEGRGKVTKAKKDTGAFKTPTLRDISKSAPYFHDGSVKDLESAVDLMLAGGIKNPYIDKKNLKKVRLSKKEKGALMAFLKSLDCECTLVEPKLPE